MIGASDAHCAGSICRAEASAAAFKSPVTGSSSVKDAATMRSLVSPRDLAPGTQWTKSAAQDAQPLDTLTVILLSF